MNFNNIEEIKKAGFVGFKKMSELFIDSSSIPNSKGVYLILNLDNKPIEFLQIGTGGFFKGKNPNVSLNELKSNWVDNAKIVYIGKAGGIYRGKESEATLKSRLETYFSFGKGNRVAHSGGKYIWQLKNSKDLIVCWKLTPESEPAEIESNFIQEFKNQNKNQFPFANHRK